MKIVPIPVLADNYAYLVIADSGAAAVVDPSEAEPVLAAVADNGVRLVEIWNTHHHWDHVGGNRDLVGRQPDLVVRGFSGDRGRIPCLTVGVDDGDAFEFEGTSVEVMLIPAHTSGHVAYHLPADAAVFTGDTLFAGGCGRLFEGDAAQMASSLDRLAQLEPSTRVFCGHEYTEKNLEFARTLEPENLALAAKLERVVAMRRRDEVTVPTTIGEELATNPFLRATSEDLVRSITARFPGSATDPVTVLARTRDLKDAY